MENVEKICELFKLAQLEESIKKLRSEGKSEFVRIMSEIDRKIEAERRAALPNIDMRTSDNKQVNIEYNFMN
jgi:DnaJ family protein C protein 2